jgi:quinol-cytochrome oxidoreductase complex cytochrome b subunit
LQSKARWIGTTASLRLPVSAPEREPQVQHARLLSLEVGAFPLQQGLGWRPSPVIEDRSDMSDRSSYVPKSRFAKWMDARLPLPRLIHDQFIVFQTPRNLNLWYTFGGILTFCLGVQMLTGIVLAMHYPASSGLAFDAVQRIMRDVNYGWLIRNIHANGASMFFIALYIHMFRGLYYGSYKAPRELLWIIGVVNYLLMMAIAFLGYVLPWSQTSYWGATVIINLFGAIPLVGTHITTWLQGDFALGGATLNRFFALHYLLPFVLVGSVALHIWALHVARNNNPAGIEVKSAQDTVPFHPYYTTKDTFYVLLFTFIFAYVVFFVPDFFASPNNHEPADPLRTPPDIVPEWYFLPFYAMLRAIPHKVLGVAVMGGAIVTLFLVPWLNTSAIRSNRFRPLMRRFFWGLVVAVIVLGYCGARPADAVVGGVPVIWVVRLATLYYFAFFWMIMPIVGLVEVPDQLPTSIVDSVQAATATRHSSRLPAESTGNAINSTLKSMLKWAMTMTRRRES